MFNQPNCLISFRSSKALNVPISNDRWSLQYHKAIIWCCIVISTIFIDSQKLFFFCYCIVRPGSWIKQKFCTFFFSPLLYFREHLFKNKQKITSLSRSWVCVASRRYLGCIIIISSGGFPSQVTDRKIDIHLEPTTTTCKSRGRHLLNH